MYNENNKKIATQIDSENIIEKSKTFKIPRKKSLKIQITPLYTYSGVDKGGGFKPLI